MSIITEGLHKTNTINSALVLEGGAMRGLFTAGILDAFMERGFYFPKVVGISAGALQGLSYISRQPGRNVSVNIRFAPDKRYMGLRHLVRDGSYFNFRFMFGKLAHEYVPFNYDKFEKASETLYVGITDCLTGKPVFVSSKSCSLSEFMGVCVASCSIPLLSKPVKLEGKEYVDGGVGMPLVPFPEDLPFPCTKPVYILTRDITYRKKKMPHGFKSVMRAAYGRTYPAVVEGMCSIPERYNEKVEKIIQMEKEGKVFVLRPEAVFISTSEEMTMEFGRFIGEHAENGLFIALIGDLGTGKTHFVQGLAKGLGINDVVSSPTFTIMNYYEGEIPLKHFDFYRLDTEEDLYNIGWEEYSEGGVTVAEWADMFPGLIPERAIYIYLSNKGTTEREVKVIWGEEAPDAITKEIEKYASCH